MSAEVQVQGALYAALTAEGLTVYDVAPQAVDAGSNTGWPYVTVGAIVLAEWDTKDRIGFDFVVRIHTHSRSGSMSEAKTIQGIIFDRLHLGDLTFPDYNLTLLRREVSDVIREQDQSFHGICEYRGLIEKAV